MNFYLFTLVLNYLINSAHLIEEQTRGMIKLKEKDIQADCLVFWLIELKPVYLNETYCLHHI